ncbi:MAG: hypothetical protein R3F56_23640 [Planctomycetota bacterium]
MWYAPTAEDWKKPVLIQWQRTWDDAVALAKETGKPILVCINMDGEIASEHYAGVRYRMPEIAKLYEPYVCVIASVYRHNPRDYDEQGHRIPCPRFGGVTCAEHIAIEPILFEKFMDGRRIAPRHIMVELDGSESYDVYYANDTASVFKAIGDGIANRQAPSPVVRGDRSLLERVTSPDSNDKVAVEQAYQQGDATVRQSLLQAAQAAGQDAPVDLLRLALFGLDQAQSLQARQALANTSSPAAVDLIAEALRVPMPATEREALVGALGRLGEVSPKARTLAAVHGGLGVRKASVDVERWAKAFDDAGGGATYAPAPGRSELEARLDAKSAEAQVKPADPEVHLQLAEATLAHAADPATRAALSADLRNGRRFARLMFEDARRTALEAETLGASGWRVDTALALAAHELGDETEAYARAEKAVKSMPPDAQSWHSMMVLQLFAHARQKAITRAIVDKKDWPQQWMADVHAAYAVLAKHPLGTDQHVVDHYDFLRWLGARGQADRVLDVGLTRFPGSWQVHERLRAKTLHDKGVDGLATVYASLLAKPEAPADLSWFAGYAALVAAEFQRRRGDSDDAIASYARGIAHFERFVEQSPERRDSADHYVAMAHGGCARVAYEAKDDARALAEVLASFERRPASAATLDGLNLSAVDTAKMLLARLKEQKQDDMAGQLEAALGKLDPELLELPAYEREAPPAGGGRGRRGRRGR